jgi:hypothetical protein
MSTDHWYIPGDSESRDPPVPAAVGFRIHLVAFGNMLFFGIKMIILIGSRFKS